MKIFTGIVQSRGSVFVSTREIYNINHRKYMVSDRFTKSALEDYVRYGIWYNLISFKNVDPSIIKNFLNGLQKVYKISIREQEDNNVLFKVDGLL